jgi:hypothetical protein
LFTKPVAHELVFKVDLLDDEGQKSKDKIDLLYLLTPEAQRKDELEAHYERNCAICPENVAKLLLNEAVLNKLRAEIKADSGYRLALEELAGILVNDVIKPEAQGVHIEKQFRRLQRAAKSVQRNGNGKSTKAVVAAKPPSAPPV